MVVVPNHLRPLPINPNSYHARSIDRDTIDSSSPSKHSFGSACCHPVKALTLECTPDGVYDPTIAVISTKLSLSIA
ncbi:hypothetical protein QUA20_27735 [Microcoleus sp. Pol7_A1]|uniref:hypothetical protein n=1 Tax=Microcoleus sp. Pol7_A1 TaxID=2818893 RepID=UPI002FD64F7B